jgi:hypothetical protein
MIPRLGLPSSLHPPATCTSSHPFHSPQSVLFSLFLVLCLGQRCPSHSSSIPMPFTFIGPHLKGYSHLGLPKQLCRGHHSHFVFLGTSASSLPHSSVPSPKETVHVVLCCAFLFGNEGRRFPYHYHPSSISAWVSNTSPLLSHLHRTNKPVLSKSESLTSSFPSIWVLYAVLTKPYCRLPQPPHVSLPVCRYSVVLNLSRLFATNSPFEMNDLE